MSFVPLCLVSSSQKTRTQLVLDEIYVAAGRLLDEQRWLRSQTEQTSQQLFCGQGAVTRNPEVLNGSSAFLNVDTSAIGGHWDCITSKRHLNNLQTRSPRRLKSLTVLCSELQSKLHRIMLGVISWDLTEELGVSTVAEINRVDVRGRSALSLAVVKGDYGAVNMLLESGADVNVCDHNGNTALLNAAERHHTTCMGLLLNANANKAHKSKTRCNALSSTQ